jgi:hypothetical protein
MFRKEARTALIRLASEVDPPPHVQQVDSYNNIMTIMVDPGTGDISLTTDPVGVTFAGVSGGDDRPLTKEALRLLALALQQEAR